VTAPIDASGFLGGIIARFLSAHPQVSVDLTVTNRHVDLIGEGIDIALRGGKLRDSTLIVVKLIAGEMVLVASPAYLKKHGTPKRIEQLEDHECLIFRAAGTRWPMIGPKGEITVDVSGRLIADDFGFIRRAAIEGAGIAFIPDLPVKAALERGRLVRVLPKYGSPQSQLSLVYPSAQHLSAKVALFRDFVVKEFAR
jgi:DNA-binding transcriptional LysR family regulator